MTSPVYTDDDQTSCTRCGKPSLTGVYYADGLCGRCINHDVAQSLDNQGPRCYICGRLDSEHDRENEHAPVHGNLW